MVSVADKRKAVQRMRAQRLRHIAAPGFPPPGTASPARQRVKPDPPRLGVLEVYRRKMYSKLWAVIFAIHCFVFALFFLITILGIPIAIMLFFASFESIRKSIGVEYNTCIDCGYRGTIQVGATMKHCEGCGQRCRLVWLKAPGILEAGRIRRENMREHIYRQRLLKKVSGMK